MLFGLGVPHEAAVTAHASATQLPHTLRPLSIMQSSALPHAAPHPLLIQTRGGTGSAVQLTRHALGRLFAGESA